MKLTLNLASLQHTISCDVVFYVLRALPLLVDKLYYEASRGTLNCDVLRYQIDNYWKRFTYCILYTRL